MDPLNVGGAANRAPDESVASRGIQTVRIAQRARRRLSVVERAGHEIGAVYRHKGTRAEVRWHPDR